MAGTITPIFRREESLPMQGICVTYRTCPARARWGQDDRSAAYPAEYILGGTPGIGTYPGGHSAVRCCATGHQSPYSSFSLGELAAGPVTIFYDIDNSLHPLSHHFLTPTYYPQISFELVSLYPCDLVSLI